MVRLYTDKDGNVTGYEDILDGMTTYKADILIDGTAEEMRVLKEGMRQHNAYWAGGRLISGEISERWTEREAAAKAVEEAKGTGTDEGAFLRLVAAGKTLREAREEIRKNCGASEAAIEVYRAVMARQKEEDRQYWAEKHRAEEAGMEWEHYVSICLLIKDENRYLGEWLAWHFGQGVDHIYIYDNGTGENAEEAIPEEMAEKVTVIPWHGAYSDTQEAAYNDFLGKYGKETRWAAFIDSDEFVEIPGGMAEFLEKHEGYTDIRIGFREYNANGQEAYAARPVRERFTKEADIHKGLYYKDFVQPVRVDSITRHYPRFGGNGNYSLNAPESGAVIHHYYTKSWEEWKEKIARGSCSPACLRRLDEFFDYNPDMEYMRGEDTPQGEIQKYNG